MLARAHCHKVVKNLLILLQLISILVLLNVLKRGYFRPNLVMTFPISARAYRREAERKLLPFIKTIRVDLNRRWHRSSLGVGSLLWCLRMLIHRCKVRVHISVTSLELALILVGRLRLDTFRNLVTYIIWLQIINILQVNTEIRTFAQQYFCQVIDYQRSRFGKPSWSLALHYVLVKHFNLVRGV